MAASTIYSTPNDFWIQKGAIRFELNALGDSDKVSVSLAAGAVIMAWKDGVIDYNAGHNYRVWALSAAPTHFDRQDKVYVYVRLSRIGDTAQIVYPYEKIPIEPTDDGDYYIMLGALTSSLNGGQTINRQWAIGEELNTGVLDTDQQRREEGSEELAKMFVLRNNVIWAQQDLSFILGKRLLLLRMRVLGDNSSNAEITHIATSNSIPDSGEFEGDDASLITTAALERYANIVLGKRYFRKDQPDTDPHLATFGNLHIASGLDKGAGTTSEGDLEVDGSAEIKGNVAAEGKVNVGKDVVIGENVQQLLEQNLFATYGARDSMTNGAGTFITNKDRLQTTNLQVRGSMTVMDLIINQLHAMEGEYYFSEVGSIERVVPLDATNSYRIYLKKETETSVITLWEGDILWSIANNLRTHKPTDGAFYVHPSWMLANAIDQDHFFVDVTLYDDPQLGIEVGSTNFPPEDGFNLVRRGNARARLDDAYKERARVWHISNTEGMMAFLDYLYSPVVGDESYQTTIGRLPDIQVLRNWFDARNLGSPSNHIGVYTQYLFAEHFLQIDWMGRVISTKNYRGEWSLATAQSATEYYKVDKTYTEGDDGQGHERPMTAYLTDTVTHMGVEWGCNRTGTTEEPSWYSADWIMIGGANEWDLALHKDDSPVPRMRQQKFEMGIFFRVSFNGYDVTDKVMAQGGHSVTWARTTDDAALDNTWNTVGILQCYRNAAHTSLLLKNDPTNNRYDFGQNFRSYRHASFNATVVIPMATGENKTISKTYNFM